MKPIDQSIFARIRKSGEGSVFSRGQFLDLGNNSAVGVALHRLVKAGKIRRIRRGLYDLPRTHPITGQTAPNIMATAQALMDVPNNHPAFNARHNASDAAILMPNLSLVTGHWNQVTRTLPPGTGISR